jgi:hypothetical protein
MQVIEKDTLETLDNLPGEGVTERPSLVHARFVAVVAGCLVGGMALATTTRIVHPKARSGAKRTKARSRRRLVAAQTPGHRRVGRELVLGAREVGLRRTDDT